MSSVHSLDLSELPIERVEILWKMLPTDQEVTLFAEYERDGKPNLGKFLRMRISLFCRYVLLPVLIAAFNNNNNLF